MTPPPLLRALELAAARAPSIYNTQPWRLRSRGDGGVDVLPEPRRRLVRIDPAGRQLYESLGCFVEVAVQAAAGDGHALLTRLQARARSAQVSLWLGPPRPARREVLGAIRRRGPARTPYPPAALRQDQLLALKTAVPQDLGLTLWTAAPHKAHAAALFEGAVQRVYASPPLARELQRASAHLWLSSAGHRDGADAPEPPTPLDAALPRELAREWREIVKASAAIVLVSSRGDNHPDWVRAGRALARLWLAAEQHHLAVQPLNLAIQDPAARQRLSRLGGGSAQVLLRVGQRVPKDPAPARLPFDAVWAPGPRRRS